MTIENCKLQIDEPGASGAERTRGAALVARFSRRSSIPHSAFRIPRSTALPSIH